MESIGAASFSRESLEERIHTLVKNILDDDDRPKEMGTRGVKPGSMPKRAAPRYIVWNIRGDESENRAEERSRSPQKCEKKNSVATTPQELFRTRSKK